MGATAAAEQHAIRIERTSEQVVDTVLTHVGPNRGDPHADVKALLEALVTDEVQSVLGRVRDALDLGEDSHEGYCAASWLVDELLTGVT